MSNVRSACIRLISAANCFVSRSYRTAGGRPPAAEVCRPCRCASSMALALSCPRGFRGGAMTPMGNTEGGYGAIAIALHWVMAALLIGLAALGVYMVALPD